MPRSRLAWLVASAALLATAPACQRETTPPLIQVREIAPRTAELGDRITITGQGFPEGKVAHVTFHGDLHRPASPPVRGVDLVVDAVATSATEVELPLNDALESSFAGSGEQAKHTTFSGDVTVSFAAAAPASPPVTGTLYDAWLDIRPESPRGGVAEAETTEGTRTLAFLGITADPTPLPTGGVRIQSVAGGSRADAARLVAHDAIVEADGVRVLSVRDVIPQPGERVAFLKVRRDGSPKEELADVSLVGLAPPPGAALLWPVVVLGLATLLALLAFAPRPSVLVWLEQRIASRLGARSRRATARAGNPTPLPRYLLAVLVPLTFRLCASDVDASTPFLVAAAVLVWAGAMQTGSPPFMRRLRGAARALCLMVPAAACVLAVIATTGSLGLADVARAQGGAPWRWAMFQSPLAAALVGTWVAAEVVAVAPHDRASRSSVTALATELARLSMCSLMAALFLGGWEVPGVASELGETKLGWAVLGGALFVAKACGVGLGIRAAARALPLPAPESGMRLAWRTFIPLSVALVVATPAWVAWGPTPSVVALLSLATLVLVATLSLHLVSRVLLLMRDAAPPPSLDPFL